MLLRDASLKSPINSGAVLLFGVLSLKVGSTKGLLMSSGHGGDQATEAKDYNTEAPKYYTTKATEYYTTSYAATTYYAEAPKFYSVLSYHTIKEAEHYARNASATYYMEIPKC
ncbi:uncharacterized protein LOC124315638 isoform X2 [Daphnia pulicaria]|uniref:uncharacterized protein LOC124315638 isoform X2 n=1 Tax=Daphnia pulicaria TaxID=35523 RepID=UPI001EEC4AC4|nr:uncharacterized protein LOC124315638 isoform X2 [Daphnia pulicaria]